MTPVTEDQVQALLDGLERREKKALRALSAKTQEVAEASSRAPFHALASRSMAAANSKSPERDVISMADKRAQFRRRLSSKGIFLNTPEVRAIPTS